MVFKMEDSAERFALYQTLQTKGAYGLVFFSVAVANHYDGGSQLLHSTVFQWNGNRFVVFQTIATNEASDMTFFTIGDESYLAVANYNEGGTYSVKSVIYKWNNNTFDTFQEIQTEGAMGCAAFVLNNDTFIAFANHFNPQRKSAVHSSVFRFSGGQFVKLQTLQSYGARDVTSFKINGNTFLAFANYYSGSGHNLDSFIYKWNGDRFALFQSIGTRGAFAWHPFVINGQTYIAVANHADDIQGKSILSVVYQASGAQFNKYQEIRTHGARDVTSFEFKGHTYLAVANSYNRDSALFKWL